MLFSICSCCEEAKWLYAFRTRYRNGHHSYRSVCKDCESKQEVIRARKRRQENPELKRRSLDRVVKWGEQNKARRLKADAERRRRKYQEDEDYKSRVISSASGRRAKKLSATPPWLTEDQKSEIDSIYRLCAKITSKTGKPHDVDHIVPLQGENVCGLHVPWNLQILPASLNRSKGNAFNSWGNPDTNL